MDNLEATFELEKMTKNTGRYAELPGSVPPIVNTIYVQQWALKRLGMGELPKKVRGDVTVVK